MRYVKRILTIFWFTCTVHWAFGQADSTAISKAVTDCEASLSVATGEFNAGRFFSLPSILQSCLEDGFTKEQRVRAYILLCQVYLITDNPSEAEASYLNLLKADPEYIANSAVDPIDVVFLSKKFTTTPVFTPHLRAGINTSFISLIHKAATNSNGVVTSYHLKPGWNFGGGLDWNISERLALSLDALISRYTINSTSKKIYRRDELDNITKLTWLDLPLYIKYQDSEGKFRPYGYAGWAFHLRLSANASLSNINKESPLNPGSIGLQFPTVGADIPLNSRQYALNQSLIFGGGMKYKWGKNYLFADLRLHLGFTNITNPEKNISFENKDLTGNGFVSNLYRVNSLNLTVGYVFPVYNPRKKGDWKAGGLLGKILYGKNEIAK